MQKALTLLCIERTLEVVVGPCRLVQDHTHCHTCREGEWSITLHGSVMALLSRELIWAFFLSLNATQNLSFEKLPSWTTALISAQLGQPLWGWRQSQIDYSPIQAFHSHVIATRVGQCWECCVLNMASYGIHSFSMSIVHVDARERHCLALIALECGGIVQSWSVFSVWVEKTRSLPG